MRFVKLALAALLTAAVFAGLHLKHGPLPPLGAFFNPFAGFWQNGTAADALPETLALPGLQAPVQVVWDERRVPHVFAQNDHDLYLAQGYLTARDRLWQMEFQTHYAAGRLAEIVGPQALELDRMHRRIGMRYGAERTVEAMTADSLTWATVEAFAAGVNAWIDRLDPDDYPLEYKLLGYAPEAWTPLKTALLLKYMSWLLTGRNNEAAMTRTLEELGEAHMDELFPFYAPFTDPVIPPDHEWDFEALPVPDGSAKVEGQRAAGKSLAQPDLRPSPFDLPNGSNNWAVAGAKTQSGRPILANDPHLSLTLPSIWYEMQLSAPGVNVYGVTLPGAPGVIVGFNEQVAWGVTNATSDVMDWYRIEFQDTSHAAYRYDGAWHPTETRIETIEVRGGATVIDTVYYTHHGPVAYLADETPLSFAMPRGAALRWIAHEPSIEVKAFYRLNRARSYDDYRTALSYFTSPAQNFVFADTSGTIALRHSGLFPLRWRGQGRYLSDGTDPAYDWQGWVPRAHVPAAVNPPREFVSSANQHPAAPAYPYYLGWDYEPFDRGARINERLAAMDRITPADMQALQLDAVFMTARKVLPTMLALMDASLLTVEQRAVLDDLRTWDYTYAADAKAPTLFEAWWRALYSQIWDDDLAGLHQPDREVTAALILQNPESPFIDVAGTPVTETLRDLVQRAFVTAYASLYTTYGRYNSAWAWGRTQGTDLNHVANIPGLGRTRLYTSGRPGTLNATGVTHGPSWRMVVSLEDTVRGWGIYPGGPSGNPGSVFYDSMVDDWVAGKLYPLLFLHSPEADDARIAGRTVLQPGL